MKIKQIATILAGALMVSSTMGFAAAASYPNQILDKNVAVVLGTNGADATDQGVATAISLSLNSAADGLKKVTTVTGGENFTIEKTKDSFNLGEGIFNVLPQGKLDDKDLKGFLADGVYEDINNTEIDYNQKIYLTNKSVELIKDKDYKDKQVTLGMHYADNEQVLTYNLTFEDSIETDALETTDLTIAGKDFYVLTASENKLELLDASSSSTISQGESTTLSVDGVDYTVSAVIYDDGAVLTVNGEEAKKLSSGNYDKLKNDVYIVAKEVRSSSKETIKNSVEFAIGKGKITLEDGKKVKVNTETEKSLKASVKVNGTGSKIGLSWETDKELFLTGETGYETATMPIFDSIQLVYTGANFGSAEETTLKPNDDYVSLETEILDGSLDLPILYRDNDADKNFTGVGEDSDSLLNTTGTNGDAFNVTLRESEDTSFVVTYIKDDEGYTFAFTLDNVDSNTDDEPTVELAYLAGDKDNILLEDKSDYVDLDDITLTFVGNQSDENATIEISTSTSGGKVYGDRIVTKEGLKIMLPTLSDISSGGIFNHTDWTMIFDQEDKDSVIAGGPSFNATINCEDKDGIYVTGTTVKVKETLNKDKYLGYSFSELASKVVLDKTGDTNDFQVLYNGEEVSVDLSVVAGGTTSASEINAVVVNDDADTTGKNLVVVGGNCVNTVARKLLVLEGGETCLADFTEKTGVANGGVLIQSFENEGNIALLVAGYSAADTVKAEVALKAAKDLDVSAGKKYVLEDTTAADASLVAA